MTGVISDIFLRLLNMSISAAFIIFVILGLRILLSKFSRRAAPVIWTAVAIKLVYPWNFQSSSNVALQNMDVSTYRSSSQSMIINHRDVLLGHVVLSEKCLILAGCIWLVGMAALVLYVVVKNWRLNRRLKTAVLYDENIWICDYIDEAFVKGVFSPRIYLPSYIEHEDLPYILRHEKLHIKRRDNWLKMIGFLFLMVYWFQPMCWVAYLMFAKDLEFACDEAVVHGMKILERKRYAKILLKFSTCQKRDVFYPLTFGYRGLKRRVEAVLIKRKMSHYVIGIIGALSITVIITVIAKPNTLFASTDTEEAWNILCEKVRDADLTEEDRKSVV